MARARTLRLILGDQLNASHPWFDRVDPTVTYVLMEVRQETDYVHHHVQKVLAFFAAMRRFAQHLTTAGHRVVYLELDDPENHQSFEANLQRLVEDSGAERFEYEAPDEYRLDRQLAEIAAKLPVATEMADTAHFLTARSAVADFFKNKKTFRMESFYRDMRKRHDVLMGGKGKPQGGKWNYDVDNRGRYDGSIPIPGPVTFDNDVTDLVALLKRQQVDTFGSDAGGRLIWPLDRDQALSLMAAFVETGLPAFGTFQDAMTTDSWSLFHSRLSFALNTKMLHPREVIDAACSAWEADPQRVSLNQVEGFVRQILGWREYMRGCYWALMPAFGDTNFFSHDGPLPDYYWTGDVRMRCMAAAIGQSLEHAYAHHIQRLMVTGNFALLAGVNPDAVDAWYLGVYIDAIEWVEMPNTRGMSQFADGGRIATKPYVSSARYIQKMSDYCADCPYDPARRHGENACPFNSLYWAFLDRHRELLGRNPRMGMIYRTWDRFSKDEQRAVRRQADRYRSDLNTL